MSRKTILTLVVLFFLSLAVSFLAGLALQRLNRTERLRHPFPRYERNEPRLLEREPFLQPEERFLTRFSPIWVVGRTLAAEIFFFLAGFLAFSLFPQRFRHMLIGFDQKGVAYLGIGITTAFLGLLLGLMAVISGFGLLFLPYLFFLFGLFALLGMLLSLLILGNWLRRRLHLAEEHFLLDLALGSLAFFVVGSLPGIDVLAFLLAAVWGWGAIVATRFGAEDGWKFIASAESPNDSTLDNL